MASGRVPKVMQTRIIGFDIKIKSNQQDKSLSSSYSLVSRVHSYLLSFNIEKPGLGRVVKVFCKKLDR